MVWHPRHKHQMWMAKHQQPIRQPPKDAPFVNGRIVTRTAQCLQRCHTTPLQHSQKLRELCRMPNHLQTCVCDSEDTNGNRIVSTLIIKDTDFCVKPCKQQTSILAQSAGMVLIQESVSFVTEVNASHGRELTVNSVGERVDRLDVQVVCRFVEQQNVGLSHRQPSKDQPALQPIGELPDGMRLGVASQPKPPDGCTHLFLSIAWIFPHLQPAQ